jgi:cysteine-rich repeat protein
LRAGYQAFSLSTRARVMLDFLGMRRLVSLALLAVGLLPVAAGAQSTRSLRFFGNGTGDIDRVKISIDAPPVPADVGGSFTIEFWMKASSADNGAGNCTAGGVGWINGNSIFDRDIFGDGDFGDYGISLFEDGIAFGVAVGSNENTICGSIGVDDGAWHHIAVTRDSSSGNLGLFVDGVSDASDTGPTGNASYRDGRAGQANDPFLVLGAEKHDAGSGFPSYSGFLDEIRISSVVRYTGSFTPPAQIFAGDPSTVALYHLEEGSGNCTTGMVINDSAPGGASDGVCRFGGSPAGPVFSTDVPALGAANCGNGMLDAGEQCDDGDQENCDGCDSNCTNSSVCGNGIQCGAEQCDDGNGMSGDGCEANCTLSPYDLISGKSLLVKDQLGNPNSRKIVLVSKDPGIQAPAPSSPSDPRTAGLVLRLARGVAEIDDIALPASGWRGLGSPEGSAGYRYTDSGQALGPCKKAMILPGRLLRAVCSGGQIDFTLDEASQGQLTVTLEPGSGLRSCASFGGSVVKDTSTAAGIGRFKAKNAPAPGACPLP